MRMLPGSLSVCCAIAALAALPSVAQIHQSWARTFFGAGLGQTIPAALAAGPGGEIYVTGQAYGAGFDLAFTTLKYDPAGNLLWATNFNGTAVEGDFPVAIRVGPDGDIVVTGRSGRYDVADFATVKYSPSGSQVWVRRFDGGVNSVDHPAAMIIDVSGNIYVSGSSVSPGSSRIVTIAYAANGAPIWTNAFEGFVDPGFEATRPVAIALDAAGNVYVGGTSETTTGPDFATIKYSPAGTQLWAARYDGPVHQQDTAAGLVVDALGNSYVTGISLGRGPGMIFRFEFTTVKYDPDGNQLWAAREGFAGYNSVDVRGITTDSSGNVLVLGSIFGSSDSECVLLKYDPNGVRLWTARYNSYELGYDSGHFLAVDPSDHAVVAGVSASPLSWRLTLLNFDPSGNRVWETAYLAPSSFDYPVGLALAATNIYIAAHLHDPQNADGYLTVKFTQTPAPPGRPLIVSQPAHAMAPEGTNVLFAVSASGAQPLFYQWRYDGRIQPDATNSSLSLPNVLFDQTGDYWVEITNQFGAVASPVARLRVLTPPSITRQPDDQFAFLGTEAIFAVSAIGTEPFQYQWFHNGFAVPDAVDSLLVLTNIQLSRSGDYTVVVVNQSGAVTSAVARLTVSEQIRQEWVTTYDGPASDADVNPIVKIDGAGNAYVIGTSHGAAADSDFVVIKYDPAGIRLWTARYSAESNSTETVYATTIDHAGNVWVAGATDISELERDALTVKFSPAGELLWAARFGTNGFVEAAFAVAVDDAGHAYVAGQNENDYLLVKYDSFGTQLWVATFNGIGDGVDAARAVAVAGTNVFVTGTSWNGSNFDFLTLKYTVGGVLLWTTPYDAGGADSAVALAVDSVGNVVVAGNSYGTINYDEFGSDYLVVKYSGDGLRQWTARYDGYLKSEDYPSALAVDPAGNVYVTGHSDFESDDSGVRQFATLKYDAAGRQLWRAWHIGRQHDGSRTLEIDSAGNVYITSLTTGPFSGRNIGFIKYDPKGARLLLAEYNGPGNSDDMPSTLALDSFGNVYVAGTSSGTSGTGEDFVLAKYSQSAVPGLPVITVPPASQVVARGASAVFSVTAMGDPPLRFQWQFNGQNIAGATGPTLTIPNAETSHSGNYSVRISNLYGTVVSPEVVLDVQDPPAILVQPQSQIAIPGSSVSFDITAAGTEPLAYQWRFRGVELTNATDRVLTIPDVQLADAGDYEIELRNQVGVVLSNPARLLVTEVARQAWAVRHNGPAPNSFDTPAVVALGPDGAIHVAGRSSGIGTGLDYLTVKYDTNGNQLWIARYNGPANDFDLPSDLALDAAGNVYVTGNSWGGGSREDITTIKYDPAGNELWVARFNGPQDVDDHASAIAVDATGNIYVTGFTISSLPSYNPDVITIKYSSSGTQLWAVRYDGPGNGYDAGFDIAVSPAGRAYVAGTSVRSGINTDFVLLCYDTNGSAMWTNRYNGPGNAHDAAVKICLDAIGNVYIGGDSENTNGFPDFAVIKYDSSGARLWVARYESLDRYSDYLYDLAVDGGGNVFVTGTSHSFNTGTDYATLKISAAGERLWLARYDAGTGASDNAVALALDLSGRIYVTGTSQRGSDFDALTLCYDTNGNRLWTAAYASPGGGSDAAAAIAADLAGNVFVACESFGGESAQDFVLINYAPGSASGAPAITVPPQSADALIGDDLTFSVSASGDSPLHYKWRRDSSVVSEGLALSTLLLNDITAQAAGHYSVEIANPVGAIVSPTAELRVDGPVIPRFASAIHTNGLVYIHVLGQTGHTYRLDASSDLQNWIPVSTNYNQTSSFEFIDPLAAGRRFYRAVKLP